MVFTYLMKARHMVRQLVRPDRLGSMRAFASTSRDEPDIDGIAYGFMASQALFAALEMGIFDKVAKGATTLAKLQAETSLQEPRLQTLLTALTATKLLRREGEQYSLPSNVAQFMVRDAKHFYGDYLQLQVGKQFYGRMGHLPQVMQTGDAPEYVDWFAEGKTAELYTRAQHNGSIATANALFKRVDVGPTRKALDVGGGSGAFMIVLCEKTDANAVILELPFVAQTGAEIVKSSCSEDVANRIRFSPGSALDEWPADCATGDYDLVLMSYISGSVPEAQIQTLYEKAHRALQPGGMLIVHDFMVQDTLDGPPLAALWALQHVTVNSSGLGLCPQEVAARAKRAGFERFEEMDMIKGMTKVVVAYK